MPTESIGKKQANLFHFFSKRQEDDGTKKVETKARTTRSAKATAPSDTGTKRETRRSPRLGGKRKNYAEEATEKRQKPESNTPKRLEQTTPSKRRSTSSVSEQALKRRKADDSSFSGSDDESSISSEEQSPPVQVAWGSLKPCTSETVVSPRKTVKTKKGTKATKNSEEQEQSGGNHIKTYSKGLHLSIISHPQEMFDDMISVQLTKEKANVSRLKKFLKKMHNRPLRVATMCSGTESPVLALDMLSKSIEDFCHTTFDAEEEFDFSLQVDHVFSCEIEPFKQAYIERNFQPPLLFRDIRELGNDQATTAYGRLTDVPNTPGCVDMLVAGISCVDYSNLNNKRKGIDDKGESGQTWRGFVRWLERAKPPLAILENVSSADWGGMVSRLEKLGYSAQFKRVDTKMYYIPQTRTRGYLFAIKKARGTRNIVETWQKMLKTLERPTSAALDAFMLPNDDPRVLRGRARLSVGGKDSSDASRVDWTRCEGRHQLARSTEELGGKRPLTGWSDSANTTMPGFMWNEWVNAQVHRIHDLMDINILRCASDGVDITHKTMVWNLSQNVDRDTMGKLGLCQCLTPNGVPYVTNRGGPLVGEELLLLQGIPADDLLLTKETEDNLKDLAGNAMSTTVVGACMIAALLLGHDALGETDEMTNTSIVPSLVPRSLAPVGNGIKIIRKMAKYTKTPLLLGPNIDEANHIGSIRELQKRAASSSRLCTSEGLRTVLPYSSLIRCKECGHTSSVACATPPRKFEEHVYEPISGDGDKRTTPDEFQEALLNTLPLVVRIESFDSDAIPKPDGVDDKLWEGWKCAVSNATQDAIEYRFCSTKRSHTWTITFRSHASTRLELRLSGNEACWYLFADCAVNDKTLRQILESPVARMQVDRDGSSVISGKWEVHLPTFPKLQLRLEGRGNSVETWGSRLGLQSCAKDLRYSRLFVELVSNEFEELGSQINGEYRLLPKCGTACGSLHIKETSGLFFFLESGRCTAPHDDTFVFATTCHRMDYGEYRDVLLKIDPKVKFTVDFLSDADKTERLVDAVLPGKWAALESASLTYDTSCCDLVLFSPSDKQKLVVPMDNGGWKHCPELLCCDFPMPLTHDLYERCQRQPDQMMEVNLTKSRKIFESLAFVTARLSIPGIVSNWTLLDSSEATRTNDEVEPCVVCSPRKPGVRWRVVEKRNKKQYIPVEDGQEAAEYERGVKNRPNPWLVRLKMMEGVNEGSSDMGLLRLQVGCNPFSLVHRALGMLPDESLTRQLLCELMEEMDTNLKKDCIFDWRIVIHEEESNLSFPTLSLTSNAKDQPAIQPPEFEDRCPLRPEQLRSLAWMLQRESDTEPFMEEEVVEAILPSLNWRLEGRVRRPVLVRGGIVADEVGYGKTAITLGLISAAPFVNGKKKDALPSKFSHSHVGTQATLVIVPAHLLGQWPNEIEKFLGQSVKVVSIKDMNCFNRLKVKDICNADIVVVSSNVLSADKYFYRLARVSGVDANSLPGGKSSGGRHFEMLYQECLLGLAQRVSTIKNKCAKAFHEIEEAAARAGGQGGVLRLDGKRSVYRTVDEEETKQQQKTPGRRRKVPKGTVSGGDHDPWGLSTAPVKRNWLHMKCPPLEMFFWNRVVVDEFHYLEKVERARVLALVVGLKTNFRWCLSGTPPHANFKDAQSLAALLGIQLGVDDVLPDAKPDRRRKDGDQMESEKFANMLEIHSIQWHQRRHRLAQEFYDRFVRQNIAEIDEIECEMKEMVVSLPPAEKAIYLELETYLASLEMNGKKALKSKKGSRGDRESRMQKILKGSASAEEALLKRCAHFDMECGSSSTALDACKFIIKLREEELEDCEAQLLESVGHAILQRRAILRVEPKWAGATKTEKGEVQDRLELFLQDVERDQSVSQGADNEVHARIKELVDLARKDPKKYFKSKVEACENDSLKIYDHKFTLREHMHEVRTLAKELCGRVRSLRYIRWVRDFQVLVGDIQCPGRHTSHCDFSDGRKVPHNKLGILSCCGHVGSLSCLAYHADRDECIDPSCKAAVKHAHIVPVEDLGVDRDHTGGGRYGRKLTAVVKKIKELQKSGDRVVVFVQFDDLTKKVLEALDRFGVKALQVKGRQKLEVINTFQRVKPKPGDARVLLLKMDDETSSGVNLTTCNHAVFVHPLLANSQYQYEAFETQAIGRIRRYGQTKTVHVWRYLARETIDTRIYKERTGNDVDSEENGD